MREVVKIKAPPWTDNWALQWVVLVLLFALAFCLWGFAPTLTELSPHPALTQLYSQLGQHLANGLGFMLPPGSAYGQAAEHTAPLYPLAVAGVLLLFGKTADQAQPILLGLQYGLLCLSILLVFFFGRVRIKAAFALLLAGWVTLMPAVWGATHGLSPDLLFLACSFMALNVIDKYFANTGDKIKPAQVLHCSVWVTACVLANISQGLLLMVAFVVLTFAKLGLRRGTNATIGMLLVLSPWVLWFLSRHPEVVSQALVQLEATFWPDHRHATVPTSVKHIGSSIDWLFAHAVNGLWGQLYLPEVLTSNLGIAWAAIAPLRWLVGGLVIIGVFTGVNQFAGVASGYMLLTMAAAILGFQLDLLASPAILPLVAFYLIMGLRWLMKGLKDIQLKPVGMGAIWLTTLLFVANCLITIGQQLTQPTEATTQPWLRATRWLAQRTSPTSAVATSQPEVVRLLAQRPAMRAIPHMDANLLWEERQLVGYVLVDEVTPTQVRKDPVVYKQGGLRIWKVTHP